MQVTKFLIAALTTIAAFAQAPPPQPAAGGRGGRGAEPGGGGLNGILTTAGKLLFQGDLGGNLVAFDPANGKPLWHSHIGGVSNAPETYMLDGHQYILVAAGDSLFAFTLY